MMAEAAQLSPGDLLSLTSEQLEKQLREQPKLFADALADAVHCGRLTPQQLSQTLFGDGPAAPPSSAESEEAKVQVQQDVVVADVAAAAAFSPPSRTPLPPALLRIRVYVAGNHFVGKTAMIQHWCRSVPGTIVLTVMASLAEDGALNVRFQNLSGDVVCSGRYDWTQAIDSIWKMLAEQCDYRKPKTKLVLSDGTRLHSDEMLLTYFESVREKRKFSGSSTPVVPTVAFEMAKPEGLVLEFEFLELQPGIQTKISAKAEATPAAVILVFSVDDRASYDTIPGWRKALGCAGMPILLAGNKVDQPREVGAREITWHRRYDWPYFDVSAESGLNMTKPLQWMARRFTDDVSLEFPVVQKSSSPPGPLLY